MKDFSYPGGAATVPLLVQPIAEGTGAMHKAMQQLPISGCNDVVGVANYIRESAETLRFKELELARQDSNLEWGNQNP